MPATFKLLVAALRMALREPKSVGQRSLSMVLGAGSSTSPERSPARKAG